MFACSKQKVAEKQWRQKEAKASKHGFMRRISEARGAFEGRKISGGVLRS